MKDPSPRRLHHRLLVQAKHLASKEKKRPQQASLRRAVSAAYYALFHLLVDAGARRFSSGAGKQRLRLVLARAFTHEEMAATCKSFASGGALPKVVETIYGPSPVPPDLRRVAEAFLELQKSRHDADYGLHVRFTRTEVIEKIRLAEEAFEAWERVATHEMATLFLVGLLTWKKVTNR